MLSTRDYNQKLRYDGPHHILSDHSVMNVKINHEKITRSFPSVWKISNQCNEVNHG